MDTSIAGFRTVLLATAETSVLERFGDPLREAGHRVIEATKVPALLKSLKVGPGSVDLLLLDLRLTSNEGPGLLKQVRDHTANLPVIVFSGSVTNSSEVRELAALGIAGYVNEHCNGKDVLTSLAPYLFPDSFNRRSSPRIVVEIPVSYRIDNAVTAAVTLNIGGGGLAIRTTDPINVSAKVTIRFSLPGFSQEIEAKSRVTWSDSRLGMGLQFEQVSAVDQATIDDYVQRHLGS